MFCFCFTVATSYFELVQTPQGAFEIKEVNQVNLMTSFLAIGGSEYTAAALPPRNIMYKFDVKYPGSLPEVSVRDQIIRFSNALANHGGFSLADTNFERVRQPPVQLLTIF